MEISLSTGQFDRRKFVTAVIRDISERVQAEAERDELERMLRRLLGERIFLSTDLARDLAYIHADPTQVQQVILNLTVNARDAMPAGGTVLIKTANGFIDSTEDEDNAMDSGDCVVLSVIDDGHGMDRETTERVFDPFFSTKEPGSGTGLGLAVVYGIVRQHNGYIKAESEPGKGTAFHVYFPATDKIPETRRKRLESANEPRGDETILVAEDNPVVRRLVQNILTSRGYHVLTAENAPVYGGSLYVGIR